MTPTVEAAIGKAIDDLDAALKALPDSNTPLNELMDEVEAAEKLIQRARDRLFELLPPDE
jgi:uncharacterized protein involved in exopolysaccharide biosynthesis